MPSRNRTMRTQRGDLGTKTAIIENQKVISINYYRMAKKHLPLTVVILTIFVVINKAAAKQDTKHQPKTSHGYQCVRRNYQLFCPKPPSIHNRPGSITLQQANAADRSEQEPIQYESPTISQQLSSGKSDNNKQQPCSHCDRSSSQTNTSNHQQKAISRPHVPSFYAYLPHEVSTKQEHDVHEHLIVDVAHDKLHNEYETLHEAPVVHRVKRDKIHEFIEENKGLMKRMFGVEAPSPIDDEIVYSKNTLYPMSNYAYATDFDNSAETPNRSTGGPLHDRTNNHYGDNYSGQHNQNSESNNNNYYAADQTGSLLSTVQPRKSIAQPRKRIVTLASASQGSSNATTTTATIDSHNENRKLTIVNSVNLDQQYKQRTSNNSSTKGKNATREAVQDHDVATRSAQIRLKRSSRTNGVVGNIAKDLFAQRVDSCESHLEVVTPYWASNSHGHVRAIVNSQHMQQAIQQEICKTISTVRCNDECSCEQKYKWHRMLAYDPEENCKGIFMDWFLFPSNCVCRCIVKPPAVLTGQPSETPLHTKNSIEINMSPN